MIDKGHHPRKLNRWPLHNYWIPCAPPHCPVTVVRHHFIDVNQRCDATDQQSSLSRTTKAETRITYNATSFTIPPDSLFSTRANQRKSSIMILDCVDLSHPEHFAEERILRVLPFGSPKALLGSMVLQLSYFDFYAWAWIGVSI